MRFAGTKLIPASVRFSAAPERRGATAMVSVCYMAELSRKQLFAGKLAPTSSVRGGAARRRPLAKRLSWLLPPPVDDPHHLARATVYLKYPVSLLPENESVGLPKPLIIDHRPVAKLAVEPVALFGLARRQAAVVLLGKPRRAPIAPEATIVILEPIIVIETIIVIEAVVSVKARLLDPALQDLQPLLQVEALIPGQAIAPVGLLQVTQSNELALKASSFLPRDFPTLEGGPDLAVEAGEATVHAAPSEQAL